MKRYLLAVMKGQKRGLLAQGLVCLLWPFSLLYAAGLFCHRTFCFFKGRYKAPRPVVSIGNITVGGAGKTPLVIWLARHLQDKGLKCIILIRGYMPKAACISDEVDMINEQIPYIPVLAGGNRVANIREAEDVMPVDLYICDDAFQHWPLKRDLDIVVIDAGNPFGNGHLLPAGTLREGLAALKRAHIFVLTKTDGAQNIAGLASRLRTINPKALIMESRYKSAGCVDVFGKDSLMEDFLDHKTVLGFCAVGDPISFHMSLKNTGAHIAKVFSFPDHHVYETEDIRRLVGFCRSKNIETMVTTHKDAVKLKSFREMLQGTKVVYIPIQLEMTKGTDEFYQTILSVCRR